MRSMRDAPRMASHVAPPLFYGGGLPLLNLASSARMYVGCSFLAS